MSTEISLNIIVEENNEFKFLKDIFTAAYNEGIESANAFSYKFRKFNFFEKETVITRLTFSRRGLHIEFLSSWDSEEIDYLIKSVLNVPPKYVLLQKYREDGIYLSSGYVNGLRKTGKSVLRKIAHENPTLSLTMAIINHSHRKIKEALEAGADPNVIVEGVPGIFYAISNEQKRLARRFIECGADVNIYCPELVEQENFDGAIKGVHLIAALIKIECFDGAIWQLIVVRT